MWTWPLHWRARPFEEEEQQQLNNSACDSFGPHEWELCFCGRLHVGLCYVVRVVDSPGLMCHPLPGVHYWLGHVARVAGARGLSGVRWPPEFPVPRDGDSKQSHDIPNLGRDAERAR